ncbi:MAG: hypothetical protein IIX85_05725 [Clostridia bacterium]|nr:hypothetical protein [Clostridia bacterium]MBQ5821068.1 hypothetical protein [Clostridia bacterium]
MKKQSKGGRAALVICIILALLILAPVAAVLFYGNAKLDKIQFTDGTREVEGVVDPENKTVIAQNKVMTSMKDSLPEIEIVEATVEVRVEETVTNILMIVTDEESEQLTDDSHVKSISLISKDKDGNTMKTIAIDGSIGVKVLEGSHAGEYDRLSNTYVYGGEALLKKQVQEAFRVQVDQFVRINEVTLTNAIEEFSTASLGEINQLADKYLAQIRTDFSKGDVAQILTQIPSIIASAGEDTFSSMEIPLEGWTTGANDQLLYAMDFEQLASQLQDYIYGESEK